MAEIRGFISYDLDSDLRRVFYPAVIGLDIAIRLDYNIIIRIEKVYRKNT